MEWNLERRLELLAGKISAREFYKGPARWLTTELVKTPESIERLRAWCLAGGLQRPAPSIREVVRFFGDEQMLPVVVSALTKLAPQARDCVLEEAAIFGVGWSSLGWMAGGAHHSAKATVLLCGACRDADALREVALHEFAHVWLEPRTCPLVTTAAALDVHAAFNDPGAVALRKSPNVRRKEHIAIDLARQWDASPG